MARERFREGVQYFDQKQFDKARAAFLQAYALKRHPAVLLNLAQSELRSDYEADAAKHFAQYLREHKDASPAERDAAENGLLLARAKVAEVTVNVDEEGATISVDGATEGQSPLPAPIFLKPGTRTITARKDGREATAQLTLTPGQAASASLRLRKTAAAAPPKREEPKREEEAAPSEPPPAPAESEASGSLAGEAGVSTGDRQPFFEWAVSSPVALVGGSLAVLGLAGTVGFAVGARQKYSDGDEIADLIRAAAANDMIPSGGVCARTTWPSSVTADRQRRYRDACNAYKDAVDKGDRFETLSWISAGVGAVAVTGTVVYYFVAAPRKSESGAARAPQRAALVPWLLPGSQGVVLSGEF